ncbi:hypothetical protein E2C11_29040 [Streptomyces lavendulae]|uniref:hypothetical protein n=1 Tax=Streptomyces albus TaxID=1888 RepID=UPI0010809804|nr:MULTISPECIES: hypothetical protein [Streptomyces]TXJ73560.1 hypothetical protein E2C11_29040 [Streptomyces lavendulae]
MPFRPPHLVDIDGANWPHHQSYHLIPGRRVSAAGSSRTAGQDLVPPPVRRAGRTATRHRPVTAT